MTATPTPPMSWHRPAPGPARPSRIWMVVTAGLAVVLVLGWLVLSRSGDDGFTHVYELNGSLEDERGGAELVATGGTIGPNGFLFERGDGLTASVDLGESFTIELRVRIDESDHGVKLLDFHDLWSDGGFYVYEQTQLMYWFSAGCAGRVDHPQGCPEGYTRQPLGGFPDAVVPGSFMTVTLERDGDTGLVSVDLDGIAQTWEVVYPPWATPAEATEVRVEHVDDFLGETVQRDAKLLHILLDDPWTRTETGSGELDYVKIAVR